MNDNMNENIFYLTQGFILGCCLMLIFGLLAFRKGKRSEAAESGSAPAKGCADRASGEQPDAR